MAENDGAFHLTSGTQLPDGLFIIAEANTRPPVFLFCEGLTLHKHFMSDDTFERVLLGHHHDALERRRRRRRGQRFCTRRHCNLHNIYGKTDLPSSPSSFLLVILHHKFPFHIYGLKLEVK